MGTYSLTGADSIIINDIPLNDFADGTIGTLEVPNDLFGMVTGKDANTIFALNEQGNNANLNLRILLGSATDKRLNGLMPQTRNFARTILVNGSLVKQIGDGQGNITLASFNLQGGMIRRFPPTSTDVAGDTNQAVVEYTIAFAKLTRSIA